MTISFKASMIPLFLAAWPLAAGIGSTQAAGNAAVLMKYVAKDEPPVFDNPTAAIDAFKKTLAGNDFDGLAKLLGLDATTLKSGDGIMDTFARIRGDAVKKFVVEDLPDRKLIEIGDELWPFPFPVVKSEAGKWAFDTYAGLEEIMNRRVGENEIQAIDNARAYVEAQRDYASEDHDGDGVLEYARKLLSSPGKTDGLYWPSSGENGVSPIGDFASEAALNKAKAGEGYFGYRFRILTRQGNRIAGGKYDYVINGNMIAGFALIAWPVKYADTGVHTFLVNQQGIVYEKDLGPKTEAKAKGIRSFNPGDSWQIVDD